MLRKSLVIIIVGFLLTVSSFAQKANEESEKVMAKTNVAAQQDFTKNETAKVDFKKFDKETLKSYEKGKKLSKGAKIGIWTGVIVGAVVITALIIRHSIKNANFNLSNQ